MMLEKNVLIGVSEAIDTVNTLIKQVAKTNANVLILGESGTGKELVAQNIHYSSERSAKPFVPVNCGAIPAELLESELFGHERGAFTGAIVSRMGRFELAHGGTLFLDEIGDMPLNMQVKLLRVLQEKNFEKIGSNKSISTNVRLIAATNRNLENEIEQKRFREDLFYRLNVFPIETKPLRDRLEDISILLHHFSDQYAKQNSVNIHFSPDAILTLEKYSWPGNVRELANLVERLAVIYPNEIIDVCHLPHKILNSAAPTKVNQSIDILYPKENLSTLANIFSEQFNLKDHLLQIELKFIHEALIKSKGIVAKAAEQLGLQRTTLVEKLKKHGIDKRSTDKLLAVQERK